MRERPATPTATTDIEISLPDDLAASGVREGLLQPTPIEPTIARDPDDDQVLAAAVAAGADWIVSGDLDLLELGAFEASSY